LALPVLNLAFVLVLILVLLRVLIRVAEQDVAPEEPLMQGVALAQVCHSLNLNSLQVEALGWFAKERLGLFLQKGEVASGAEGEAEHEV
jgi:cytochrome b561